MDELEALSFPEQMHVVITDDVTATDRVHPDLGCGSRAGSPVAPVGERAGSRARALGDLGEAESGAAGASTLRR